LKIFTIEIEVMQLQITDQNRCRNIWSEVYALIRCNALFPKSLENIWNYFFQAEKVRREALRFSMLPLTQEKLRWHFFNGICALPKRLYCHYLRWQLGYSDSSLS